MGEPSTVKYANNLTINISKFVSCEKLVYVKVREPDSELHVVFFKELFRPRGWNCTDLFFYFSFSETVYKTGT